MKPYALLFVGLIAAAFPAAVLLAQSVAADSGGREQEIRRRLQAYTRVDLPVDLSGLTARDREAVGHLVAAADAVDILYWKQMGRQSLEARRAFQQVSDPLGRLYREFIEVNYGPFDVRDDMRRFVTAGGDGPRLPGAGFYPEDMTKEEFEARLEAHPELRDSFERIDTHIRRVDGVLVAIPFATLYIDELKTAAQELQEAAALVESRTLRRYLSLRAEALLSGDYYPSDLAWLDVRDNLLDIVIGPIETYGDQLLGLKASYEGAVLVKDVGASRRLDVYKKHLDGMSRALPVDARYRKASVPAGNVLEVVNVVRFTGDFNAGIKTVAASLPNDERVIQEKGAKKQIYKNVLEAKFDTILSPIAALFLRKKDQALVTREAFVTNVLLHELSHTLGVDYVAGAKDLTVRKALRDRYSPIEEAKADVVGLFNMQYLKAQEIFTEEEAEENYATYLAGMFRSVRFGSEEAHGLGTAVQLNFLMREGAVERDAKTSTFSIHGRRFEQAIARLAAELLTIEATGDYERAGRLLSDYGRLDGATVEALRRTEAIPVDVVFNYAM